MGSRESSSPPLPSAPKSEKPTWPAPSEPISGEPGPLILESFVALAESDDETRRFVAWSLRERGFTVHSVRTGEELLDFLDSSSIEPAVVIVADRLPNMSSGETVRQIGKVKPSLPVIVMSDQGDNLQFPSAARVVPRPYSLRDVFETSQVVNGLCGLPLTTGTAPVLRRSS